MTGRIAPYHILWRAVLAQAFQDACTPDDAFGPHGTVRTGFTRLRLHERDHARAWLLHSSPDLEMVCQYAAIDPTIVILASHRARAAAWTPALLPTIIE